MEKKKFDFKKFSLVLCICFVTLFAFIPFANFNTINSVSAVTIDNNIMSYTTEVASTTETTSDEIKGYEFKSSSIVVPTARYRYYYLNNNRQFGGSFEYQGYDENQKLSSIDNFSFLFTLFSVKFKYDEFTGQLLFAPTFESFNLVTSTEDDYEFNTNGSFHFETYSFLNYMSGSYSKYKYAFNTSYLLFDDWGDNTDILVTRGGSSPYFESGSNAGHTLSGIVFEAVRSVNLIDITKITHMTTSLDSHNNSRSRFNITYYDVNSNYVTFRIASGRYDYFNDIPDATYYFTNDGLVTDNDMYNQGYQNGQNDGYNFGYNSGLGKGYDEGYSSGTIEGYSNGYNDGINDSDQYTFYNLFGAVLDAPVKVFSNLFNFELLGINLLGLITGLFTLAMIILVIKLILGGK